MSSRLCLAGTCAVSNMMFGSINKSSRPAYAAPTCISLRQIPFRPSGPWFSVRSSLPCCPHDFLDLAGDSFWSLDHPHAMRAEIHCKALARNPWQNLGWVATGAAESATLICSPDRCAVLWPSCTKILALNFLTGVRHEISSIITTDTQSVERAM